MSQHRSWYRSWPVELAVRLLYACGLLHLIGLCRRYLGRKRLIVLLYHRLAPPRGDTSIAGLEFDAPVPVDRFERHLKLLRWFGQPLALQESVDRLRDPAAAGRSYIAVTFDDGYLDNYILGRPLWNCYQVPVTVFPALGAVARGDWLWWDELQKMVGESELNGDRVRAVVEAMDELAPGTATDRAAWQRADRAQLARLLFERMVDSPIELRELLLDELASRLGTVRPARPACVARGSAGDIDRLYVGWKELIEMAGDGSEIGGHTIQHPRLPCEAARVAEHEIRGCRAALQHAVRQPIRAFAYPGGFYGERELDLIRRAGYDIGVTVTKGVNYPASDPLQLRRIALSWDDAHHLAFKLAFADWLF